MKTEAEAANEATLHAEIRTEEKDVQARIRAAVNDALERAAKICDFYDCTHGPGNDIRALKEPT